MYRLIPALIFASATAAIADTPMSGAEFDQYATGKTLYFGSDGGAYGAEQYLPGRRVIWTFLDGECEEGSWYESGNFICFAYDSRPEDPQCWIFLKSGDGVSALFDGDPQARELIEVQQNDEPLICPGPKVGV